MKKLILSLFLSVNALISSAINWESLLQDYKRVMDQETYQIVTNQYNAFVSKQAPIISDHVIKQIPINECGEELVDLETINQPRITVMKDNDLLLAYSCPEDIDPRSLRHSQVRKGVFNRLVRMIDEVDCCAPFFGYESGDLEIKLFEGLRDIATQKELFNVKMNAIMQANPNMTEQKVYEETCKWVSPYINNVPVHSTGAAIDIHLWSNKAQTFCDMGRFNVGGNTAPTFSLDAKLSEKQALNRLLFLIAATRAGLTNYVYEFWHFSFGDRYAAYWRKNNTQKQIAIYNSAV